MAMPKKRSAPQKKSSKPEAANQPKAGRPFAPGYGLSTDVKGLLPWSWVVKQMEGCHTFWVATVHPENRPHVMPVWGVWVDDVFFFSTGRKSRKGQNLVSNPACTVTNDDGEEAVIIDGSAEEEKDSGVLEGVAEAYKKKYKMDPRSMGEPI